MPKIFPSLSFLVFSPLLLFSLFFPFFLPLGHFSLLSFFWVSSSFLCCPFLLSRFLLCSPSLRLSVCFGLRCLFCSFSASSSSHVAWFSRFLCFSVKVSCSSHSSRPLIIYFGLADPSPFPSGSRSIYPPPRGSGFVFFFIAHLLIK